MEYTQSISVPVDKLYSRIPIFAKQGDYNSRYFLVTLTRNGQKITPTEIGAVQKVVIGITRKDGQAKAFGGTYNSADGTLTLPLPKWAVERGKDTLRCDAMIYGTKNGESQLLRSASFTVNVDASGFTGDDISEDEKDIIAEIIAKDIKIDEAQTRFNQLMAQLSGSLADIQRAIAAADKIEAIYSKMQITFYYNEKGEICYTDTEE